MGDAGISREAITGHLFSAAVEAVNRALRKERPGASVDQVILDGHFEPALLMLWVAAREQVYERHLVLRREALVADFLAGRYGAAPPASLSPAKLLEDLQAFGTFVYDRLEALWEETSLVREGIFTLVLNHPLGVVLTGQEAEGESRPVLRLAPHPGYPQLYELSLEMEGRRPIEIRVHGHVRQPYGESGGETGRAAWNVYLIPPDEVELEDLQRLLAAPRPPRVYTWAHVVDVLKGKAKGPLHPLGQLPNDLIALMKSDKPAG